ncbi:hypothetical protein P4S55_18065 [Shewanella sp. PP-Sp27a-2]
MLFSTSVAHFGEVIAEQLGPREIAKKAVDLDTSNKHNTPRSSLRGARNIEVAM